MNSSQLILFVLLSSGLLLEWYARNPSVFFKGVNFIVELLVDFESQHLEVTLAQESTVTLEWVMERGCFFSTQITYAAILLLYHKGKIDLSFSPDGFSQSCSVGPGDQIQGDSMAALLAQHPDAFTVTYRASI